MASAQLATVLLPKMDSHLQIVIYMNIVVISIFVLSLIIYLTENVYWYNGVEFSEALEAGTEKRKAIAVVGLVTTAISTIHIKL